MSRARREMMKGKSRLGRLWRSSLFWKTYILSVVLVTAVIFLGEGTEDLAEYLTDEFNLPFNENILEAVVWLLVITLATLAGSYLLSRLTTDAMTSLKVAAEDLASGRLSARVTGRNLDREDEIGQLSRSFNHMADSLTGLLANERRLIRDISHEIRSPLARLKMAAALFERKGGSTAADGSAQYLSQIDKDIGLLDALIDELLEQSRLESLKNEGGIGNFYGREMLDFRDIIEDSVRSFSPWALSENLTIEKELPLEVVCFSGNALVLRRIIDNLIKNALSYSNRHTVIRVKLEAGPTSLTLLVSDQGPGIPPEHLTNIFRPFYRVDDSRARDSGGFGLGLSIVRQAVELHGGTIAAVNRPEGGLMVTVTLPRPESGPAL